MLSVTSAWPSSVSSMLLDLADGPAGDLHEVALDELGRVLEARLHVVAAARPHRPAARRPRRPWRPLRATSATTRASGAVPRKFLLLPSRDPQRGSGRELAKTCDLGHTGGGSPRPSAARSAASPRAALAIRRHSASFARPSTGGAVTRITTAPARSPTTSSRLARGCRRTVRSARAGVGRSRRAAPYARRPACAGSSRAAAAPRPSPRHRRGTARAADARSILRTGSSESPRTSDTALRTRTRTIPREVAECNREGPRGDLEPGPSRIVPAFVEGRVLAVLGLGLGAPQRCSPAFALRSRRRAISLARTARRRSAVPDMRTSTLLPWDRHKCRSARGGTRTHTVPKDHRF